MTPRVRSAVVRGTVLSVAFFVIRVLLLLWPGRTPEPLTRTVLTAVVVGVLWGIVSWLLWPREQRRLSERGDARR
ncbi:hypothetical protein [Agilicoccus flavus]|uniref:hypothetical protein n=1 Tax=Agilicoccus flavus TaxID=2775968 RepID=UPI001CF641E3|nr:hypothetical protein [Agilicoccus flavus]